MKLPKLLIDNPDIGEEKIIFLYNKQTVDILRKSGKAANSANKPSPTHIVFKFAFAENKSVVDEEAAGAILLTSTNPLLSSLHITCITLDALAKTNYARVIKLRDYLQLDRGLYDIPYIDEEVNEINKAIQKMFDD